MPPKPALPDCPPHFSLPCALTGAVLTVLLIPFARSLTLGDAAARTAVGLALAALALFALLALRLEGCPGRTALALLLPIAAALYLRLLCLDHQTHDYQTFLSQWVEFYRENGGFSALKYPVGDYNVPYLYLLAAFSCLPVPDLYLIKLSSILFDLLLAWAGLRICRRFCREGSPAPLICFAALLFLPTVLLNGAYWGQCDSIYTALLLLAFSCVLDARPKTSVVLLAFAFSFKLQAVFLLPLWCVFWFTGWVKFRHLLLFPCVYALSILPALALGKPLADILGVYLGQMSEYSGLTLNAPSIFAFLPHGAQVDEQLLARIGIAGAFALVLFLLGLLFQRRRCAPPELLLNAAAALAIGVPFLLPYMHERYFFPADVLTLIWACTDRRRAPVAALVCLSSLSSYSTYLNLRYTLPIQLGGWYFVMGLEALFMLAALIWTMALLLRRGKADHILY